MLSPPASEQQSTCMLTWAWARPLIGMRALVISVNTNDRCKSNCCLAFRWTMLNNGDLLFHPAWILSGQEYQSMGGDLPAIVYWNFSKLLFGVLELLMMMKSPPGSCWVDKNTRVGLCMQYLPLPALFPHLILRWTSSDLRDNKKFIGAGKLRRPKISKLDFYLYLHNLRVG